MKEATFGLEENIFRQHKKSVDQKQQRKFLSSSFIELF